jgi:hypothetical protein
VAAAVEKIGTSEPLFSGDEHRRDNEEAGRPKGLALLT